MGGLVDTGSNSVLVGATDRAGSRRRPCDLYWQSWTYDTAGDRATQTGHGPPATPPTTPPQRGHRAPPLPGRRPIATGTVAQMTSS